jgi:hypothetical protein
MNPHKGRTATIVGAAAALALVSAGTANAAAVSDPIVEGLSAPLGLAVGDDGTLYVSQSDFSGGPGSLSEYRKGALRTIAEAGFVTGVEAKGRGTTSFLADGQLRGINPSGKVTTLADLAAYETMYNPDAGNSYGLQGLSASCEAEVAALPPDFAEALLPHSGVVDSNPYAVAILANGDRVVADAGGNDLVKVSPSGAVSTLAVLPPRSSVISGAADLGLPACVEGLVMNFDFVPTDVEVGPDGMLYVSSLPGGPEGPSPLGPRGGVFTVHPRTGAQTQIGDGFYGATDLAVTDSGDVYVTELYSGRVSKLSGGGPVPIASLVEPVAIEYASGVLYVSAGVFSGPGTVVMITP